MANSFVLPPPSLNKISWSDIEGKPDIYSKNEVNNLLSNKANTSGTYNSLIAGDVNNIKNMSIAVDNSNHYAWFLNYSGPGNNGGARKYYASVRADRAQNLSMSSSGGNLYITYS